MYGGLPYGFIVYGGYLISAPGPLTTTPTSNVEDLQEVAGTRLGCGEPVAFVTVRCGQGVACVLDDVISLQWDRRLDDISEAEAIVGVGGDCCLCLADVEPWCHELHIWRDGAEVWVGPITEITYSYNQIRIRARDSLAWLTVRVPSIDVSFLVDTDLSTIGSFIITTAFALDTVTCEIDNLYVQPTGFLGKRFFEAFSGTAFDFLDDLADTGLDYTTLGRTIVLVGDTTPLTPLILLTDEHILGELEVTKDGELQGNRWYVHFDGDLGTPASGEAVDFFCYGPIERLRSGDGLQDGVSAGQAADIYVASTAIAPRILEVPPGSRLSPETPWTINEMVPGARVDVALTKTCFMLTQSFRLTQVQVSYSSTGESVGITLAPVDDPSLVAP